MAKAISIEDVYANLPVVLSALGLDVTIEYQPSTEAPKTVVDQVKAYTAHPRLVGMAAMAGWCGRLGNMSVKNIASKENPNPTIADLGEARQDAVEATIATGQWVRKGGGAREGGTVAVKWEVLQSREKAVSVDAIKAKAHKAIKARYGDKEKLSLSRYLDCIAAEMAESKGVDADAFRAKLYESVTTEADELIETRKAEAATVDVGSVYGDLI